MGSNALPDPTDTKAPPDTETLDWQRPIVAVDIALLTLDPERGLVVVEMWRDDTDSWALPGVFLGWRETLSDAVRRCLRDKVGVEGVRQRQLHVFDDPDRDNRDRVLSVAHAAVVRPDRLSSLGEGVDTPIRLAPVDRPGELAWDHSDIVRLAKHDVRSRYRESADPDHLLGREFTLRELFEVHQAVLGTAEKPDRFRREMVDRLERTDLIQETGGRGRPAELFRRKR